MKADAESKPQGAANPEVQTVPGDHFFMRRFDLPAGMAGAEVPGYVALQLEEMAPFPLDQLNYGYAVAPDGGAVFVYAAYRRRTPSDRLESWTQARFVLPDFAPGLRLELSGETLALVRSQEALTALYFDGVGRLPARAASRPLASDAPQDELESTADTLRTQLGVAADVPGRYLRVSGPPNHRAKGLEWALAGEGRASDVNVFVPLADCWAMDVRDAGFVEQQRRRLKFEVVLWRVIQGVAALFAVLLLGELALFGVASWRGHLQSEHMKNAPVVAALDAKNSLALRLDEFGRSALHPFEMIAAIQPLGQQEGVWFMSATAEGGNRLKIEGAAANAAAINNYVARLRRISTVSEVPDPMVKAAADSTTFTLTLSFKPEAFGQPATASAADAKQGGGA